MRVVCRLCQSDMTSEWNGEDKLYCLDCCNIHCDILYDIHKENKDEFH